MSSSCLLPEFTLQQVLAAADTLFGVSGEARFLDGERDLNCMIESSSGAVIFKIANEQDQFDMLECQQMVFERVRNAGLKIQVPTGLPGKDGNYIQTVQSQKGIRHFCRIVQYLPGKLFSQIKPHTPELLESVGSALAAVDCALEGFNHSALDRALLWKMENAMEIVDRFKPLISDSKQLNLLEYFQRRFKTRVLPQVSRLRTGVIHNDANDNNLLVQSDGPWDKNVSAIIDFGDMVESWIVTEVAVASAYAILGKSKMLDAAALVVKGYNRVNPLSEQEISVIFEMLCMRLCLSVSICAFQRSQEPDNEYLNISEQPAWEALETLARISPEFAHFVFRDACGLEPVPENFSVVNWVKANRSEFGSIVDIDCRNDTLLIMDTSVSSPYLDGPGVAYDPDLLSRKIFRAIEDAGASAGIGRYNEYRTVYASDNFIDETGNQRTLHLGIDIFMSAGEAVYAPMAGTVYGIGNNNTPLDYGGSIVLQHQFCSEDGAPGRFYTLYGHLNPEFISQFKIGEQISKGQKIAELGGINENGYWPPHIHFEIITNMLEYSDTFVGVGSHAHRKVWLSLCPDPNLILCIPDSSLEVRYSDPKDVKSRIASSRQNVLGSSLSLSYRQPIHVARGSFQYLYDFTGRRFLDAVNNVPHVGHCHPVVVDAQIKQARVLNTNTRYLYSQLMDYSERLISLFPDPLDTVFLVNSGSEANDLALRMVKNYTGRKGFITVDHAYHGNLSSLIDISPYKHDGRGGSGTPEFVAKVPIPDIYRGKYRKDDVHAVGKYIDEVKTALNDPDYDDFFAGFICESISGCGGQVVLPDGYLAGVYDAVRAKNLLCIADEVQVGLGRVGTHMWAFETQDVVPDIVTLGKPLGNGHPLAAVITTRSIADAFANGMEYFNTFGGNPVSCAIGNAVLDVLEKENLMEHANKTGHYFVQKLKSLQQQFPIIGDVRGKGLFIGIELVDDHDTLQPAADQAAYISERMRQESVLISTDGPLYNVLKIKPPMCFNCDNVNRFVSVLGKILQEDFAQPARLSA